jgi:hypothetical protein
MKEETIFRKGTTQENTQGEISRDCHKKINKYRKQFLARAVFRLSHKSS